MASYVMRAGSWAKEVYKPQDYFAVKETMFAAAIGHAVARHFVTGFNPMLGAAIIGIRALTFPLIKALAQQYTSLGVYSYSFSRVITTAATLGTAFALLPVTQACTFVAVSLMFVGAAVDSYNVIAQLAKT